MRTVILALAAGLTFAAPAAAEIDADARLASMERSQAEAQAAAIRPGDEALTCDALQTEMTTTMNGPEMQAFNAQNSAFAANAQERMANARSGAGMAMGMGMMGGIASAFIPGMGFAQSMAMRAYGARMQGEANANQAMMAEQSANVEAAMPTLMRGQRIYELAQAKNCAFLQAPTPQ